VAIPAAAQSNRYIALIAYHSYHYRTGARPKEDRGHARRINLYLRVKQQRGKYGKSVTELRFSMVDVAYRTYLWELAYL
jgi:hypothetical protein